MGCREALPFRYSFVSLPFFGGALYRIGLIYIMRREISSGKVYIIFCKKCIFMYKKTGKRIFDAYI